MLNIKIDIVSISHWKFLCIFLALSIIFAGLTFYVLKSDELYFQFYGDQLSYERIIDLIKIQNKWQWVAFLLIPLIYLIKFFLISCVLLTGTFIVGYRVEFREIFKVTVIAEFVMLVPLLLKLLWFGLIERDYSMQDLINFAPLSLDSIMNVSESRLWLAPLFKSINLFELAYWIALSLGLYQILQRPFNHMFGLVVASYGSAWVVWQVFVIFLMINLSP